MGVITTNSTMMGAVTPICNECGIVLCWDISLEDYATQKDFWDNWRCKLCDPDAPGSLKRWASQDSATSLKEEAST
jgi:hypothetical protein